MPASSNPPPGPEPKLEAILVETERERLFDIIRELVKWENSNDERVSTRRGRKSCGPRAAILHQCMTRFAVAGPFLWKRSGLDWRRTPAI